MIMLLFTLLASKKNLWSFIAKILCDYTAGIWEVKTTQNVAIHQGSGFPLT